VIPPSSSLAAAAGVIIGYVGASHIPAAKKESHAQMLMSGASSAPFATCGRTHPSLPCSALSLLLLLTRTP